MKLADQIEEIVLCGELPAGSKLDEMALARRFNVSRTPVREALRRLASTGLIELIPNRGAFTATLSESQLAEMFIAMAELEASCARLAAISMSPAERQAFQRLHDRMGELVAPNDVRTFGEMDEAFHVLIFRGAHNHYMEEIADRMRKRLSLYRRSQFRTPRRSTLDSRMWSDRRRAISVTPQRTANLRSKPLRGVPISFWWSAIACHQTRPG